jgi:hypothetical protein
MVKGRLAAFSATHYLVLRMALGVASAFIEDKIRIPNYAPKNRCWPFLSMSRTSRSVLRRDQSNIRHSRAWLLPPPLEAIRAHSLKIATGLMKRIFCALYVSALAQVRDTSAPGR